MVSTLVSCTEDYTDWADIQGQGPETPVEVAFTAKGAPAYNFNEMGEVNEIRIFTPEVQCNVEDATTTYAVVLNNEDKSKSAELPTYGDGMATIADVTSAIVKVAGTQSVERVLPMTIMAYTKVNGAAIVSKVENVMLTATIVPIPVPEVWFISGNCVGNGAGSYLAESCVAMLPNPDNFEEIIIGVKLNPSSTFRFYKQEGKGRYPYIAQSKTDGSLVTVESSTQVADAQNITPGLAEGYYKIVFNVKKMELTYEAIEGFEPFTAMSLPGDYQGWAPANNTLNAETTSIALENHDWSGTVTFAEDTGFKFCANLDWCGNDWGSLTFPLGVANVSDNIKGTAGTYKVYFNDLTKYFYFQAVEE